MKAKRWEPVLRAAVQGLAARRPLMHGSAARIEQLLSGGEMNKPRTIDTHTHVLTQETAALLHQGGREGHHHARCRRRERHARRDRHGLPAVPARRLRHRAPPARHGCGAMSTCRCSRRRRRPISTVIEPARARRHGGDPERPDRQARRRASGSLLRRSPRCRCRRRRKPPTNCAASMTKLGLKGTMFALEHHGQESRRSELRAVVGDRRRARRLHVHPSEQRRRRRPAEVVLSATT